MYGKSTFFNYLVGTRISIVQDTPGVTRDRIYAETNWRGRNFTLVDTGGIEPESQDIILSQMREQANLAIEMADVIIFLTDIKQGVTAADRDIALMLKKSGKPIVLVCNKADNYQKDREEIYEFYNLGIGEPYPTLPVTSTSLLLTAQSPKFTTAQLLTLPPRQRVRATPSSAGTLMFPPTCPHPT